MNMPVNNGLRWVPVAVIANFPRQMNKGKSCEDAHQQAESPCNNHTPWRKQEREQQESDRVDEDMAYGWLGSDLYNLITR